MKLPKRKVKSHRARVQTYRIYMTLDCGHTTSMTRPAGKENQVPSKAGCWDCYTQSGVSPWIKAE